MSGPVSRASRFWVVGIILILIPVLSVAWRWAIAQTGLTIVEALYHGLVILAGIALLDWEIAARLFGRLSRLRSGRGSSGTGE